MLTVFVCMEEVAYSRAGCAYLMATCTVQEILDVWVMDNNNIYLEKDEIRKEYSRECSPYHRMEPTPHGG